MPVLPCTLFFGSERMNSCYRHFVKIRRTRGRQYLVYSIKLEPMHRPIRPINRSRRTRLLRGVVAGEFADGKAHLCGEGLPTVKCYKRVRVYPEDQALRAYL